MHKKRILIVDDEAAFTKLTRLNLERTNRYEVREENNSAECLTHARDFKPDLIVLDVVMPEKDGGSVLADLRADAVLRQIPVVLLTATVTDKILEGRRGVFAGLPVLAKPVPPAKLIRQIETMLETAEKERNGHGAKSRFL